MNTSLLLLGVLFSSIGVGYVVYGRRQRAGIPLVCGIALVVIPYVIGNGIVLTLAGVVIAAIPWLVRG